MRGGDALLLCHSLADGRFSMLQAVSSVLYCSLPALSLLVGVACLDLSESDLFFSALHRLSMDALLVATIYLANSVLE